MKMITTKGAARHSRIETVAAQNLPGFSRIDLLGALAAVAILASLSLSGSVTSATTSKAIQCLENGHQLIRAWTLYANCNGGALAPNVDNGAYGNWLGGSMNYAGSYGDPTNYGEMNNTFTVPGFNGSMSALGNYIFNYKICRCPEDQSLGSLGYLTGAAANAPRVRSYSMSGAVGSNVTGDWLDGSVGFGGNSTYATFGTLSSFVRPGPAQTFVVVDEDPTSINDACLGVSMVGEDEWIDRPASHHNNGDMFTFADGHCVIKHWVDPRSIVTGSAVLLSAQPNNPDIEWLRSVTTILRNGPAMSFKNPSP
jgi:hypothetical protein